MLQLFPIKVPVLSEIRVTKRKEASSPSETEEDETSSELEDELLRTGKLWFALLLKIGHGNHFDDCRQLDRCFIRLPLVGRKLVRY